VVLFSLHLKEDVNEDGTIKPAALEETAKASGGGEKGKGEPINGDKGDDDQFDEEKALDEARKKLSGADLGGGNGSDDDYNEDID